MSSVVFKEARAGFDALAELADEPVELLSTEQRLEQLDRISSLERILPALRHELVNELVATATGDELGGSLVRVLADRLRIYRGEANRLIEEVRRPGAAPGVQRRTVGPAAGAHRRRPAGRADQRRARPDHPRVLRAAAPLRR